MNSLHKRFPCTAIRLTVLTTLLLSLFALPSFAAGTRDTIQSTQTSLERPILTVVTQTNKTDQLALRWNTSKHADGYLLKYKKDTTGSWKKIWIRDADKSSYVLNNLKRSSYTIRIKAYTKKKGTYSYSKTSSVSVNRKRIVQTGNVEEIHETYVLLSFLDRYGKKSTQATVSMENLNGLKDTVDIGDTLLMEFKTLKESEPAQIDDVISIQKLK